MARVKVGESEKLDDTNIQLVLDKLYSEKPITKKEACSILCISYNTTRLEKILQNFTDKQNLRNKRKAENKGKPASEYEINETVVSYLKGEAVSTIAEGLFRSPTFVKNILEEVGCPLRAQTRDYFKPELIPEEAIKEKFAIGEKVYSARYDSLATIESEHINKDKDKTVCYGIFLEDEYWLEKAYQPWYELASLEHLRLRGIKL